VTAGRGPGTIGGMTPPFIPGLELAAALYAEVVAPQLEDEPGRPR
jgi:hypothetical protein